MGRVSQWIKLLHKSLKIDHLGQLVDVFYLEIIQ